MPAKLSIAMPVFNHPEELKTMLDSILANTYQDWELLAIDDGSEQETLALLEQYAERDERIRFIKRDRQPKGAQTCRNMGLELAKGEYIIFFDSDDYLTPQCLEERVRTLDKQKEADFVVFPSGIYTENQFKAFAPMHTYGYAVRKDDVQGFLRRNLPFVVWNNIYRTSSLRKSGIQWDEKLQLLQDCDFNLQSIHAGLKYVYAETVPHFGYRIMQAGSITTKIKKDGYFDNVLFALEKGYRLYGKTYPYSLYLGMLTMFMRLFGKHFDAAKTKQMVRTTKQHTPFYGMLFQSQIGMLNVLRHLMPYKFAFLLTFFGFKLHSYHNLKAFARRKRTLFDQFQSQKREK